MEEVGLRALKHSPILMPTLLAFLRDTDQIVVSQSIVSGMKFFCSVLEDIAMQVCLFGSIYLTPTPTDSSSSWFFLFTYLFQLAGYVYIFMLNCYLTNSYRFFFLPSMMIFDLFILDASSFKNREVAWRSLAVDGEVQRYSFCNSTWGTWRWYL